MKNVKNYPNIIYSDRIRIQSVRNSSECTKGFGLKCRFGMAENGKDWSGKGFRNSADLQGMMSNSKIAPDLTQLQLH